MKNRREILMIDDKFSKWHPILEKSAEEFGFSITNSPSVEEGLEKLRNYPGSFEAVIMGLAFVADKMQGKEGLLKIKEIDDYIPIIILTAKADDLQVISECIRLGAYDYFSKTNINPGHLFLHIESAIQQSLQKHRLSSFTTMATESNALKPYFYFDNQIDKQSKGFFAYRLKAVACGSAGNQPETEYLSHVAWEWHYNFLNTITFYDPDLILRLRYLYSPGAEYIDPVLIIEINEKTAEHAKFRYEEIRKEFDLYLQAKKDFKKTIYYFVPIADELDLRNILFPFNTDRLLQFTPELSEITAYVKKNLGFSTTLQETEEIKLSLPLLLKPEISLENFCEVLSQQRSRTMVEIMLNPVKLSREEVDYLRGLLKCIDYSNKLTLAEQEKAHLSISSYLNAASKCFNVEVFGAQESKRIGKDLLSAISSGFFDNSTHVNAVPVLISRDGILKKQDEPKGSRDWHFLYSQSNIVNIFKFPYPYSTSIPGINSYNPIFGYLPDNLSKTGPITGIKSIHGHEFPIRIRVQDLRKHLYILGQTGTGKTTILYSMIMERILSGKGVCVVDPHGDLHKKILEDLPKERLKDLIVFEPGNPGNDIRINLLEYNKENPQEKSFIIDELFNFFRQEYDATTTMGPIFELFMKNSLLLLMDDTDDPGSIGDLSKVFQDDEFRRNLLNKCRNQEVLDFWNKTAVRLTGDYGLVNMTPYIISKLNQLLMNDFISPIVITKKSNINFRAIIDCDKILLVSLSKGKIGKIGVNILGTVILSRILNAAYSRENIPEHHRNDYTLFVDEFQNFVSQAVMSAMSEARKYRLSMVLANQTLGQLSEQMKQSVLGNVGSTIFFRPGINDVDYIMPYFIPYLTRENVLNLPNFKGIARLQINDSPSLPFIFDTIKPDLSGNKS